MQHKMNEQLHVALLLLCLQILGGLANHVLEYL
jgi:hypothetical protein